ncbi:hypothetical protein LPM_0784 [Legionella pneumophila subsp. pneumophila str. Mississauga]|nr:hypothetical protein LPM_0784 [Legionella pneumophila subsp. pneumophila str. Mississauga]
MRSFSFINVLAISHKSIKAQKGPKNHKYIGLSQKGL